MSGCVNCVWDGYREELEIWVASKNEARRKETRARMRTTPTSTSMDDDGGGSEALWNSSDKELDSDTLLEGLPVGIREFIMTEKRLGERKKNK